VRTSVGLELRKVRFQAWVVLRLLGRTLGVLVCALGGAVIQGANT
jgi:hypothetical protein